MSETDRSARRGTGTASAARAGVDRHPPAVDPQRTRQQQPDGPRQEPVLDGVEALEERLLGVAGQDRDRLRDDDRAAVEGCVDKVDRDAGDGRPGRERVADGVGAGERRQQRRMDVEDPTGEGVEDDGADEAHEAGQHDRVDLHRPKRLGQVPVGHGTRVEAPGAEVLDEGRVDPRLGRPVERRARPVGEDEGDLGVQGAPLDARVERPQVAAAPGDADRDPDAHRAPAPPALDAALVVEDAPPRGSTA